MPTTTRSRAQSPIDGNVFAVKSQGSEGGGGGRPSARHQRAASSSSSVSSTVGPRMRTRSRQGGSDVQHQSESRASSHAERRRMKEVENEEDEERENAGAVALTVPPDQVTTEGGEGERGQQQKIHRGEKEEVPSHHSERRDSAGEDEGEGGGRRNGGQATPFQRLLKSGSSFMSSAVKGVMNVAHFMSPRERQRLGEERQYGRPSKEEEDESMIQAGDEEGEDMNLARMLGGEGGTPEASGAGPSLRDGAMMLLDDDDGAVELPNEENEVIDEEDFQPDEYDGQAVETITVSELKKILREKGLAATGRKGELVTRLKQWIKKDHEEKNKPQGGVFARKPIEVPQVPINVEAEGPADPLPSVAQRLVNHVEQGLLDPDHLNKLRESAEEVVHGRDNERRPHAAAAQQQALSILGKRDNSAVSPTRDRDDQLAAHLQHDDEPESAAIVRPTPKRMGVEGRSNNTRQADPPAAGPSAMEGVTQDELGRLINVVKILTNKNSQNSRGGGLWQDREREHGPTEQGPIEEGRDETGLSSAFRPVLPRTLPPFSATRPDATPLSSQQPDLSFMTGRIDNMLPHARPEEQSRRHEGGVRFQLNGPARENGARSVHYRTTPYVDRSRGGGGATSTNGGNLGGTRGRKKEMDEVDAGRAVKPRQAPRSHTRWSDLVTRRILNNIQDQLRTPMQDAKNQHVPTPLRIRAMPAREVGEVSPPRHGLPAEDGEVYPSQLSKRREGGTGRTTRRRVREEMEQGDNGGEGGVFPTYKQSRTKLPETKQVFVMNGGEEPLVEEAEDAFVFTEPRHERQEEEGEEAVVTEHQEEFIFTPHNKRRLRSRMVLVSQAPAPPSAPTPSASPSKKEADRAAMPPPQPRQPPPPSATKPAVAGSGWGDLQAKLQRPGSWTCDACLSNNIDAAKPKCPSCEAPKPKPKEGEAAAPPSFESSKSTAPSPAPVPALSIGKVPVLPTSTGAAAAASSITSSGFSFGEAAVGGSGTAGFSFGIPQASSIPLTSSSVAATVVTPSSSLSSGSKEKEVTSSIAAPAPAASLFTAPSALSAAPKTSTAGFSTSKSNTSTIGAQGTTSTAPTVTPITFATATAPGTFAFGGTDVAAKDKAQEPPKNPTFTFGGGAVPTSSGTSSSAPTSTSSFNFGGGAGSGTSFGFGTTSTAATAAAAAAAAAAEGKESAAPASSTVSLFKSPAPAPAFLPMSLAPVPAPASVPQQAPSLFSAQSSTSFPSLSTTTSSSTGSNFGTTAKAPSSSSSAPLFSAPFPSGTSSTAANPKEGGLKIPAVALPPPVSSAAAAPPAGGSAGSTTTPSFTFGVGPAAAAAAAPKGFSFGNAAGGAPSTSAPAPASSSSTSLPSIVSRQPSDGSMDTSLSPKTGPAIAPLGTSVFGSGDPSSQDTGATTSAFSFGTAGSATPIFGGGKPPAAAPTSSGIGFGLSSGGAGALASAASAPFGFGQAGGATAATGTTPTFGSGAPITFGGAGGGAGLGGAPSAALTFGPTTLGGAAPPAFGGQQPVAGGGFAGFNLAPAAPGGMGGAAAAGNGFSLGQTSQHHQSGSQRKILKARRPNRGGR